MRSLRALSIFGLVSAAALARQGDLGPTPALAGDLASQKPSLSELRDMRQFVESKHQQRLREIQEGLAANSYDSDTAILMRMKAEQEYKNRVEMIRQDEIAAMQGAVSKPPSGDSAGRAPTHSTLPRFPSQSVITYPQNDSKPAAPEKPEREGSQKNVGFGTRELEF